MSLAAVITVAVVALLCVLAVRAHASPSTLPDSMLPAGDDVDDAKPSRGVGDLAFGGTEMVLLLPSDEELAGDVASIARTAPPLRDTVAAAHRAAGVASSTAPTGGWRARSRWSALIPIISFRVGNSSSWRDVDDPTLVTINHGASFNVGASWRLDELVYDPNEPRFESFELGLRRERRKLASIATHLYFRWLRAATTAAVRADPAAGLRAAELSAQLDALTAGWFSDQRTAPNR